MTAEIPLEDTPALQILADQKSRPSNIRLEDVATCMNLLRVSKKLLVFFAAHFHRHGISPGKFSVLMELYRLDKKGELSPSVLAERLGVSRPTVTGLIDGLVKQKHVKREHDRIIRRQVGVSLTAKGRAFLDGLLPGHFETMASVVGRMPTNQRTEFTATLERVERRISKLATTDETDKN